MIAKEEPLNFNSGDMKMKFSRNCFYTSLLGLTLLIGCTKERGSESESVFEVEDIAVSEYGASSWTAQYASGDRMAFENVYPARREGKTVGIFYFIWHGHHGYDQSSNSNTSTVATPSASDTKSPYDIAELLKANPTDPAYGPSQAFHHWGKPYLDYYVANDVWVLRKHAQMLNDAGVDVIFLDVSNAFVYESTIHTLCNLYLKMREEGNPTPQISFLAYTSSRNTVQTLYDKFYANERYKSLWFQWDGKPLILCDMDESFDAELYGYFTMRKAWFDSNQPWYGDGEGNWCWGDYYPQKPGLKNGKAEQICIMPATHPTSNLGRSYNPNNGGQPQATEEMSGQGIYFKLQCDRALEVDPDVVFITGWNEWVAQRQINEDPPSVLNFLGKSIGAGDTYFVDQYDHEFSRDIEPVADGFRDNYYYYMVDFIRKYKGVTPPPVITHENTIAIDGSMSDWAQVEAAYADDREDIAMRNHFGWGRVGQLVDYSGRNDFTLTKVAVDESNLYFYVKTASGITSSEDDNWMRLFIAVEGDEGNNWEGFGYVVNNNVRSTSVTTLQHSLGGWSWGEDQEIHYAVNYNQMELAIPLKALKIADPDNFTIDFKWIDNSVDDGDICECMKFGDSAPNGRFRYRVSVQKQ